MERYFVQYRRAGEIEWQDYPEPYANISRAEHTAQLCLNDYAGPGMECCNEARIVKRTYAVVNETMIPVVKKTMVWLSD